MSNLRRLLVVLSALLFTMTAATGWAAEPDEAANGIRSDGVFVEAGASATDTEIGDAVATARTGGERLSVVVLAEEPIGGATTFADAVVDAGSPGLVLVIAPDTVGYAGTPEAFTVEQIESALDAALEAGGDDGAIAVRFAESLGGGGSGSGGGTLLLWIVVLGGGAVLLMWWLSRRSKQRTDTAEEARLAEARAGIQAQIDAVANDILELEDEVRLADDSRVDRFFEDASETYRRVTESFAEAESPAQLLEIANDLDEAIWQLDASEAILDGNPLPERPARRRLEPEPAEPVGAPGSRPAPRVPEYRRRPSRRSSYSGAGITDLLTVLAGTMLSSRGRTGRGGGLLGGGGLFGTGGTRSSRPRPPGSRPPTSAPKPRGTQGKRVRGGRRRRG